MRNFLKLATISILALGSTNVYANEVGLDYVSYDTGSGMRYHGSFDLPYFLKLNASYDKLNMDEITLLSASKNDDSDVDIGLLSYGIGLEYNFKFELGVYAEVNKVSLDTGSVTFTLHNGTDDPSVKELDIDEVSGMDYKVGLNYKFLDFYEIDLGARNIEYDDLDDSVTAAEAAFSFYFNPKFKVTAKYASDSFLKEANYSLGVSYDF